MLKLHSNKVISSFQDKSNNDKIIMNSFNKYIDIAEKRILELTDKSDESMTNVVCETNNLENSY